MRKILVVSPNFPPADIVDSHRIRTTIGHYRDNGWEPTVLCARAEDTGRLIDPALSETVPEWVRVETVAAPRTLAHRALRINALGLRGRGAFDAAGSRLLAREAYDLVFISGNAHPLMTLGARWKKRLGVPFVLDLQDPWGTYPESARPYLRGGLRHRLMRATHRRMEAGTMPKVDGLMAVSPTYIELMQATYPEMAGRPTLVSPFGFSRRDFDVAARSGVLLPALAAAREAGFVTCLFAGRVAPSMTGTLKALFAALAEAQASRPPAFAKLRLIFVGTGYYDGASETLATRLAKEAGIAGMVEEHPDRIPLLDSLKTTLEADSLVVLASDDLGYTPSKLFALLSLPKPVVCVGPGANRIIADVRGLAGVAALVSDDPASAAPFIEQLAGLLETGVQPDDRRARLAEDFEAGSCARRECAFLDEVLAASRSVP